MTATTDGAQGGIGSSSISYYSATPWGRALLRDAAHRKAMRRAATRSSHGLDLVGFGQSLGRRRAQRPSRSTATLGPMQVDVRLTEALKRYVAEHQTSQRVVLEQLLQELLGPLPERG